MMNLRALNLRPGGPAENSPRREPWDLWGLCALRGESFLRASRWATFGLLSLSLVLLPSCGKVRAKSESPAAVTVGVTKVARKTLQRQITLSSELVPFQEIDVYAKESGFVKNLYVD